ncbi:MULTISPECIES: hypothetical protein [unclassified Bradyrhizobium]|uniref:hypothetical protein n=1 Tax=unclassified Bradyrhizobium TaxID=2631580 RepID=UPI00247A6C62|nr:MULTISPECIES: hypothetical protein [unclassified Bradyrhizobium]WGS18583.1 hypothetical protein MTX22_29060 [Bradyrhizobium sp. ISRA463]WGS25406.1 hypothetical protein MTX19_26645 [Bradyrhizobium sp. ISRA464]
MREAKFARRLGYRSKSLVRPDHAKALNEVLTPAADELTRAQAIIDGLTPPDLLCIRSFEPTTKQQVPRQRCCG